MLTQRSSLLRRGCAAAIVLLGVPIAYRVGVVYALWPRPCPAPPRPVAQEVAIAPAARISVLSYNVEGHAALLDGDHLAAIARVIRDRAPDVVALQEVHRGTWQSRFADQAAQLGRLTGMRVAYGPSFDELGGAFGNALLTRGRILASRVVPLPSLGEPRSLLVVTVELPAGRLDVYVTHLAAWAQLNRRIRARQLACVREQIRGAVRPFVLCGDFNGTVGEDLDDPGAGGLARLAGRLDEPTHPLLGRRLDYIYADPRFTIVDAAVVHAGPSDHWPVVATLEWRGRA